MAWVGNDPTYADFQSAANPSQLPCHNGWKDRTWTCTSLMRNRGHNPTRIPFRHLPHIKSYLHSRFSKQNLFSTISISFIAFIAVTKNSGYFIDRTFTEYDFIGASGGNWTHCTLIKSQVPYRLATLAYGAEDGTWTRGLTLTKRTLYQLSYDSIGASTRIWTADVSLATRSFTPKLYLHN